MCVSDNFDGATSSSEQLEDNKRTQLRNSRVAQRLAFSTVRSSHHPTRRGGHRLRPFLVGYQGEHKQSREPCRFCQPTHTSSRVVVRCSEYHVLRHSLVFSRAYPPPKGSTCKMCTGRDDQHLWRHTCTDCISNWGGASSDLRIPRVWLALS